MPSTARKPATTDDPIGATPALAVAPKTRQRHDPKAKAQAALDRADAQLTTLNRELGKHQTAVGTAQSDIRAAKQHRDYLAMHPLLVVQKAQAQAMAADYRPEIGTEGDLSTP